MPRDFLKQLASLPLPQTFHDEQSIDKIRVLVAAELVEASLPPPGVQGTAVVTYITTIGRVMVSPKSGLVGAKTLSG